MPDFQNPIAKAKHTRAIALREQAMEAQADKERPALEERANALDREADKIESATR
jgi:hypothetical protein